MKIISGGATALITGFGTFLGTKIYTPTDSFLNATVSAYLGGLFLGSQTELVNVAVNQAINKVTNSQNTGSLYDVRKHLRSERALG